MYKIASPQDLQAEIHSIMAFVHASEKPDRQVIAAKLLDLANRVASGLNVKILKSKEGPNTVRIEVTGQVGRIEILGKLRQLNLFDDQKPSSRNIEGMTINRADGSGGGLTPSIKKKVIDTTLAEVQKYWSKEVQGTAEHSKWGRVAGVKKEKIPESERADWKEHVKRNKNKYQVKDLKSGQKYKYQGKDWLILDFDAESKAPGGATLVLVSSDFMETVRGVEVDKWGK